MMLIPWRNNFRHKFITKQLQWRLWNLQWRRQSVIDEHFPSSIGTYSFLHNLLDAPMLLYSITQLHAYSNNVSLSIMNSSPTYPFLISLALARPKLAQATPSWTLFIFSCKHAVLSSWWRLILSPPCKNIRTYNSSSFNKLDRQQ